MSNALFLDSNDNYDGNDSQEGAGWMSIYFTVYYVVITSILPQWINDIFGYINNHKNISKFLNILFKLSGVNLVNQTMPTRK